MTIQLKTLGQIDLRTRDGTPLSGLLAQPKRLALLVYLAARGPRFVRRDILLAMFWPDSDDERARASLRKALHFIRGEAGEVIVSRGAEEVGIAPDRLWLDLTAIETLTAEGRHEEAVALYRGDFLPGFTVRGAPEFERWASDERTRIRRCAAVAAWAASDDHAGDDPAASRALADRAVSLSPDDELAVRRYLRLLADARDRMGALVFYQEFAARLTAEYDVVPTAETRALVAEISTRGDDHERPVAATTVAPSQPDSVKVAPVDSVVAVDAVHVPAVHESSPRSRLGRPLRWAVAAVVALVALVATRLDDSRAAAGSTTSRVAVFPFLVRGTPDLHYLADGLPILLATRLDGAGGLRAVDPRALLLAATPRDSNGVDAAQALRVAGSFGSQLYVTGTVLGSAEALHLVVHLHDRARGDAPIARTEATGREADLAALVDRLASNLLADHLRGRGDLLSETAARTTSSLVALKAWLAGEAAMRAGRYGSALDAFDAEIAADSAFALAHFRRAVAANWAGRMALVVPSVERAVAYEDRLTPYSRTVVRAFHRFRTARYAEAESLYRVAVAEHPTAIESWYELGEVLYHANPQRGRSITESRSAFERVLQLDPHNFAAQVHLARLAAARSDRPALDSLTRDALRNDPDGGHRIELQLLRALALDDGDARAAVARQLPDAAMVDALWRASEYTGAVEGARSVASSMLARGGSDEIRAGLRILLAHLAMGAEQFAAAEREIDALRVDAPHAAALTSVLLATHPRLPTAQRPSHIAAARRALRALRERSARASVYVGFSTRDNFGATAPAYLALLSVAEADTLGARRLLSSLGGPLPTGSASELPQSQLELALASDGPARADALRRLSARDERLRNHHSASSPWMPRALQHLTAARLLAREGRAAEAAARLGAVPEDFGFNVAYLGAVRAARAELFDARP